MNEVETLADSYFSMLCGTKRQIVAFLYPSFVIGRAKRLKAAMNRRGFGLIEIRRDMEKTEYVFLQGAEGEVRL